MPQIIIYDILWKFVFRMRLAKVAVLGAVLVREISAEELIVAPPDTEGQWVRISTNSLDQAINFTARVKKDAYMAVAFGTGH